MLLVTLHARLRKVCGGVFHRRHPSHPCHAALPRLPRRPSWPRHPSPCLAQEAWAEHRATQMEAGAPGSGLPQIIYSSRTHSQLQQVIRELKKLSYRWAHSERGWGWVLQHFIRELKKLSYSWACLGCGYCSRSCAS